MSIQSEIDRIKGNVTDSLSAIKETGVNVPDGSNSNDLPNLINDLANTRQRVVDLGTHSLSGEEALVVELTEEQTSAVFLNNDAPIISLTLGSSNRLTILLDRYTKDTLFAAGWICVQNTVGYLAFAIVTLERLGSNTCLLTIQKSSFFEGMSNGAVVSSNPIQLPADPTSALQAATKQYVDDKTDDAITTNSGGVVSMGQSIGAGPYTIEMTEEEEGDLTAAQVSYNNVATGMTATDVQSAITELFTSASEGKALVAAAVTGKGVQTAADASYEQIAANVTAIETGGGTSNVSVNPNLWFGNGISSISIMYQNPDGNSENRLVKENSSFSIQVMKGSLVAISVYAYSQQGGYFYPSVNGSSLSTTSIANPDRYTRISSTQFIADGDTMTVT